MKTIYPGDVVFIDKVSTALAKVDQDKIYVFKNSTGKYIIKRCIGIPGDRLNQERGEIFRNAKKYEVPLGVQRTYLIQLSKKRGFFLYLDSMKTTFKLLADPANPMLYYASLTRKESEIVLKFSKTPKLTPMEGEFAKNSFIKAGADLKKSLLNLRVPYVGMTIELNSKTNTYYKMAIANGESKSLVEKKGLYLINDSIRNTYTFKNDYLYMLGGNRGNSVDSRATGFVRMKDVIGEAVIKFTPSDLTGANSLKVL